MEPSAGEVFFMDEQGASEERWREHGSNLARTNTSSELKKSVDPQTLKLSFFLYVLLFIYFLSIYLFIYLSIYLYVCPSIYLSAIGPSFCHNFRKKAMKLHFGALFYYRKTFLPITLMKWKRKKFKTRKRNLQISPVLMNFNNDWKLHHSRIHGNGNAKCNEIFRLTLEDRPFLTPWISIVIKAVKAPLNWSLYVSAVSLSINRNTGAIWLTMSFL